MIDHLSLGVTDLRRSQGFYDKVLATLGARRVYDLDGASGYGIDPEHPVFWLGYPRAEGHRAPPGAGSHSACAAGSRAVVAASVAAALAAGGTDNGKPGLRPEYHPSYYGAFVLDPDGHAIEAVCHRPE